MAKDITRRINLEFVGSGLKDLEKQVEKSLPFAKDQKSSKLIQQARASIQALRALYEKEGGKFSKEGADNFIEVYNKLIGTVEKLRVSTSAYVNQDLEIAKKEQESFLKIQEQKIRDNEKLKKEVEHLLTKDGDKLTQAEQQRDFESFKKEKDEKFLGVSGKETENIKT
jgi:hypothetical protein